MGSDLMKNELKISLFILIIVLPVTSFAYPVFNVKKDTRLETNWVSVYAFKNFNKIYRGIMI
jgi:hypothetical protein